MIKDLALDTSGDLYFTKDGDVVVTDSLRQAMHCGQVRCTHSCIMTKCFIRARK